MEWTDFQAMCTLFNRGFQASALIFARQRFDELDSRDMEVIIGAVPVTEKRFVKHNRIFLRNLVDKHDSYKHEYTTLTTTFRCEVLKQTLKEIEDGEKPIDTNAN